MYAMTMMPQYQCHKKVWALKIAAIEPEKLPEFKGALCRGSIALGSACGHCERCKWTLSHGSKMKTFIVPAEPGYAPVEVSDEYLAKHNPQPGGYYVVYADGYKSYSPAQAFEEDYTRV